MMTQMRDWREMFQVQTVDEFNIQTETLGDCNQNCLEAKELKCVCKCHGKNHGARLKARIHSLEEYEEEVIAK